jgi:hypothetical protein
MKFHFRSKSYTGIMKTAILSMSMAWRQQINGLDAIAATTVIKA